MSGKVASRLFAANEIDERAPWVLVHRSLCFAVIVALHGGVAWIAMHWHATDEPMASSAPAVVMIDLAPLPTALSEVPTEIPPAPKEDISERPPPPPEPEPEVLPTLPPVPPTPTPNVEVPVHPRPKPVKQPERVIRHEQPRPRTEEKPPAVAAAAPPRIAAPSAPVAAASPPDVAAPSPNAVPNWQSLLLRRLEQFKRYPSAAQYQRQQGVASLSFTMNRNGKVLSAQLVKSSGFDVLDQEALALVHRAEPLPPPPPNLAGDAFSLVVPIQFFLAR